MKCSRCQSIYPNRGCYVCRPEEDTPPEATDSEETSLMKIWIILGFAAAAWSAIGTIACAFLGSPFWAIGLACLAVLLWFISHRENDHYNERMEDRMFYQHPRL